MVLGVVRLLDGTQEFITCPEDCLRIVREKLGPDLAVQIEDHIAKLEEPDDGDDCEGCEYRERLFIQIRHAERLALTLDNIKNQLETVEKAPPNDIRALLVTMQELIERG